MTDTADQSRSMEANWDSALTAVLAAGAQYQGRRRMEARGMAQGGSGGHRKQEGQELECQDTKKA